MVKNQEFLFSSIYEAASEKLLQKSVRSGATAGKSLQQDFSSVPPHSKSAAGSLRIISLLYRQGDRHIAVAQQRPHFLGSLVGDMSQPGISPGIAAVEHHQLAV